MQTKQTRARARRRAAVESGIDTDITDEAAWAAHRDPSVHKKELAAQAAELKYRRSEMKNDDDFFKFTEMHAKEREKFDREWEKVHQLADRATNVDAIAEKALADAKKRKRDSSSSSVESTIVRKLVRRCHQCSLCSVCEHTHDRYRRSKYGDDSANSIMNI
mgnify:CR=1 FL=1